MPRAALVLMMAIGASASTNAQAAAPIDRPTHDRPTQLGDPIELARTPWPIFHANSRATASSPDHGPGAVRSAQKVRSLSNRRVRRPSVSPWTVVAEPYPDGSQAVITTPNDGVAKYLIQGDRFEGVHFLPLDRRDRHFDWGILLLRGGRGVVTERTHNRFVTSATRTPVLARRSRSRRGSRSPAAFTVT